MRWLRRQWSFFDKRILGATAAVVLVVLLAGGVEDRRSCQRQIPTRQAMQRFARAQAAFQGGLADLERPAQSATTTIIDPDTHQALVLNRTQLRRWVQQKQLDIVASLPTPDCGTIPAGR
jgi:hypothetical protein